MKIILCRKRPAGVPFVLWLLLLCRAMTAQGENLPLPTGPGDAVAFAAGEEFVVTYASESAPSAFTLSIWFKTTTGSGGRLLGFGNSELLTSTSFDRHIYMDNSGHIYFGTYNGTFHVVTTPATYNDGNWHNATGTLSATSGMSL